MQMQTESTANKPLFLESHRLNHTEPLLYFPIFENNHNALVQSANVNSPSPFKYHGDSRSRSAPKKCPSFDDGLSKKKNRVDENAVLQRRSLVTRSKSEHRLVERKSEQDRLSQWTEHVRESIERSNQHPHSFEKAERKSKVLDNATGKEEDHEDDCWASVDAACAAVADDLLGQNEIEDNDDIQALLNNLERFSASLSSLDNNDDSFSEFSGMSNNFNNSTTSIDETLRLYEESKESSRVSFQSVTVRYYDRILSDNPAVSIGPAVGIGWNYSKEMTMSVDEWEEQANRRNISPAPSSSFDSYFSNSNMPPTRPKKLRMSPSKRMALLIREGYTETEIQAMIRLIDMTKQQRRQTVEGLDSSQPLSQVLESSRRTLKRMLSLQSKYT